MRRWLALALSALLLCTSGCQAVQGIDLNGMIKQSRQVISAEGSVTYEVELDLSKEAFDGLSRFFGEDVAPLLTHIKLELDHVKVQDPWHVRAHGTLYLGDVGIGFAMQRDDWLLVLEPDGASAPIVLDAGGEEFPFGTYHPYGLYDQIIESYDPVGLYSYGPAGLYDPFDLYNPFRLLNPLGLDGTHIPEEYQRSLLELTGQAKMLADDYWIRNMPNMPRLSVSPDTPATVGGEQLALDRISVRFDRLELFDWTKRYIEALIADESGVRAVYRKIDPLEIELFRLLKEAGLLSGFEEESFEYGEAELADAVNELMEELRLKAEELSEPETPDPETVRLARDSLLVSADLYVDDQLRIRKQEIEIRFRPPEALHSLVWINPFSGLNGMRLAYSAEWWNINGDVGLEPPDDAIEAGVTLEEMAEWSMADGIRFMGRDSGLFELIFRRGKAGVQELQLYLDDDRTAPIPTPNGSTLVPLRRTADAFGVTIKYDPQTRRLLLHDDITGTDIALTVGSRLAAVNGETVEWSYPVITGADGAAYVPGRDLMKAIGGTIAWSSQSGRKVLILKRDAADLVSL